LAALNAELDVPALTPEEYAILPRDNQIFVIGADARGVVYGTYALLECFGCRWLAPAFDFYGGAHELIPKRQFASLSLDGDIIESPVLKYRKLYVEEGHSHNVENLKQLVEWMPKRRFNTLVIPIDYQGRGRVRWDHWRQALTPELKRRGITIEVGGHGYPNFLNATMENGTLFKRRPEWFGLNEQGERDPDPRRVFCTSNREAVDYLLNNVVAYLQAHPEIDVFDFWPPDGARWCECPACEALGTPSDRHARLVSKTAAVLKERFPALRLECIAYATFRTPPSEGLLSKEVLVDFCPIAQCFEYAIYDASSPTNRAYAEDLKQWAQVFPGEVCIYSYYRKYAWDSLPILLPHYMQDDLRFYHALGLRGISSYAEPGDWSTYELNHYILGGLAWNPEADVNALIEEFAAARFGPHADLGREVYALLEAHARHATRIPGTRLKTSGAYNRYHSIFLSARRRVSAARGLAKTKSEAQALERLGLMLDYLLREVSLLSARAENRPDEEREAAVNDLYNYIGEHAGEGVFLNERIRLDTLRKRYGLRD